MTRCLFLILIGLPFGMLAQDTTSCDALVNDVNGDLQVGAMDILQILGSYGQDFDVDGDGRILVLGRGMNVLGSIAASPGVLMVTTIRPLKSGISVGLLRTFKPRCMQTAA